ncbi:MAG: ATP-binding cassette domain-containing protein, partial [Mesorhizobium sp.]
MSEVTGQAIEPLLEARDIKKYFGAITALNGVSFHVSAGEALGVVGDNGAGKSTLMKILSGLYKPSEGSLFFQGQPVRFDSPRDARQMGIEMV